MLYNLGSGIMLEFKRQESIAKNLAGSSIPGYRKEFLVSSSFSKELKNQSSDNVSGLSGVSEGKLTIDFTQGGIKNTGRNLDFALVGNGFFEVTTTEGTNFYTRNGSFNLSPEGELITSAGHQVASENGSIKFGKTDNLDDLIISEDGTLLIKNATTKRAIGKLKIVDIQDKTKLQRISANFFVVNKGEENQMIEAVDYKILNKAYETANLSPVQEMATMISSLREFEMSNNVLKMQMKLSEKSQRILS